MKKTYDDIFPGFSFTICLRELNIPEINKYENLEIGFYIQATGITVTYDDELFDEFIKEFGLFPENLLKYFINAPLTRATVQKMRISTLNKLRKNILEKLANGK